jgi:hypothetical protein
VAREQGLEPTLREVLVEDAWPLFAAGDRAGYEARIAERLRGEVGSVDAVLLAQASMAGAADRLADCGKPVLASPRLGAEAAINAYRMASSRLT